MIEVHPNLYVGTGLDYEHHVRSERGWAVVHACKEPYHRQALGYTGRAAPKDHPEYLVARRGNRLILNLIDADTASYVPAEILDTGVAFINEQLASGLKVLSHCNQGRSRGPTIAMLYLRRHTSTLPANFDEAVTAFRAIYRGFAPAAGILGRARAMWGNP